MKREFPNPMEGLIIKVLYLAKEENLSAEETTILIRQLLEAHYEIIPHEQFAKLLQLL